MRGRRMVVILQLATLVAVCATAAAEPWSFDMPAGFTEKTGAMDPYVEHARKQPTTVGVDAKVYASGDVQLTRMLWRVKPAEPPTRSGLDRFDRDLVGADVVANVKRVSAVRVWYGEQMVVDAFDQLDATRIYHRRFYAADRSGVVHVLWLICKGSAAQIASCEQAQQSMRLAIADEAPLPQGEPIAEPARAWSGPWSFVLPEGYVEVKEATDKILEDMRKAPPLTLNDGRVYRSPAGDVVLVGMTMNRYRPVKPTRADIDGLARWLLDWTKERPTKRVGRSRRYADKLLVLDQSDAMGDTTIRQRHLVGVDAINTIYTFSLVCAGPTGKLAECEAAQASMELELRNVIDIEKLPATWAAARMGRWSIGNLIGAAGVVALIVGLGAWIYQSAQRGGRRRRRR